MGVGAGKLLIVHRAPVLGLELELLARAAIPNARIITANTPDEAYQALDAEVIDLALIEETSDFVAFAELASQKQPALAIGWIHNNAAPSASPPVGQRLRSPVLKSDIAALARAKKNSGSA